MIAWRSISLDRIARQPFPVVEDAAGIPQTSGLSAVLIDAEKSATRTLHRRFKTYPVSLTEGKRFSNRVLD
jgi:hypothetical protein